MWTAMEGDAGGDVGGRVRGGVGGDVEGGQSVTTSSHITESWADESTHGLSTPSTCKLIVQSCNKSTTRLLLN